MNKHNNNNNQQVLIGGVPDRGGRTLEMAAPPPEMPGWTQRTAAPQGGGCTTVSEGFKGGTRGTPIMPRDAVSRTANVGNWLRKRNGG